MRTARSASTGRTVSRSGPGGVQQRVERALDPHQVLPLHVGVDLRRFGAPVAEELLDVAQIGPAFEQVRRKTVSQGVHGHPLCGFLRRQPHGRKPSAPTVRLDAVLPGLRETATSTACTPSSRTVGPPESIWEAGCSDPCAPFPGARGSPCDIEGGAAHFAVEKPFQV